jgi:hypothetical protein
LRIRIRALAGLCALLLLLPAAALAASTAPDGRSVVVALRPLGGTPAEVLPDLEYWLNALADAVEGDRRAADALWIRDGFVVDGHVLSFVAGQDLDAYLRERAEGAPLVLASVTRLVDRYGLEVRLLLAGETPRRVQTLDADGTDGLLAALDTAGAAVRASLHAAPQANPAEGTGLTKSPSAQSEESGEPVSEPAEFGPEPDSPVERPAPGAEARVVEIRIEGTRRIEPDAIRAAIRVGVGDPIEALDLGADVRRIYALGFFRDVQVTATDAPGGEILTFLVEENPIIRQVSLSGNESLGVDDIREHMTLTVGSTIDFPLLIENKTRISSVYASRGFYETDVTYTIEPLTESSVGVNFEIEEGRKLRLVAIQFEGNEYFSEKELRKSIETKPWGWTSYATKFWTNAGLYQEPLFYQDLDTIARKYMDAGFIRVRLGEPEVSYDEDGLRVAVSIDEGDQYATGMVDVIGDPSMDTDQVMSLVTMEPGQVFSRSGLSDDVETLQTYYADRGFYFAKVTPRTSVDPESLVVDCAYAHARLGRAPRALRGRGRALLGRRPPAQPSARAAPRLLRGGPARGARGRSAGPSGRGRRRGGAPHRELQLRRRRRIVRRSAAQLRDPAVQPVRPRLRRDRQPGLRLPEPALLHALLESLRLRHQCQLRRDGVLLQRRVRRLRPGDHGLRLDVGLSARRGGDPRLQRLRLHQPRGDQLQRRQRHVAVAARGVPG